MVVGNGGINISLVALLARTNNWRPGSWQLRSISGTMKYLNKFNMASTPEYIKLQGLQGLSAHFEKALTGRKNVAMSKLMVASNSQ